MGAVYVVKRSETCNRTIDIHGMDIHASPTTEKYPVRIRPTHKHLQNREIAASLNGLSRFTHTCIMYMYYMYLQRRSQ